MFVKITNCLIEHWTQDLPNKLPYSTQKMFQLFIVYSCLTFFLWTGLQRPPTLNAGILYSQRILISAEVGRFLFNRGFLIPPFYNVTYSFVPASQGEILWLQETNLQIHLANPLIVGESQVEWYTYTHTYIYIYTIISWYIRYYGMVIAPSRWNFMEL